MIGRELITLFGVIYSTGISTTTKGRSWKGSAILPIYPGVEIGSFLLRARLCEDAKEPPKGGRRMQQYCLKTSEGALRLICKGKGSDTDSFVVLQMICSLERRLGQTIMCPRHVDDLRDWVE
jgi:hypothetical protein